MKLIPDFVTKSSRWTFPWLPPLLFCFGLWLLFSDSLGRRRETQEAALAQLVVEVRAGAEELESLLQRLVGELDHQIFLAERGGSLSREDLVSGLSLHLADLDPTLVGIALQGPSGGFMEVGGSVVPSDSLASALSREVVEASEGILVTFHDGLFLPDGRSVASLSRLLQGEGDVSVGFLHFLISLEEFWSEPYGRPRNAETRSRFLLDDLGHLLLHPDPEWIGYLMLTEADSLYDPDLLEILPEVMSEAGGGWALMSETLRQNSTVNGITSLLAASPVHLPDGGRWTLGVYLTPDAGVLPGLPPVVPVELETLLMAVALMTLAFLLPFWGPFGRRKGSLGSEGRWLAAMTAAGSDGLLVLNRDQRIMVANEEFCGMVGVSPEALKGTQLRDLLETHGFEEGDEEVALEPGRSELWLQSAEGSVMEVETNSSPFSYGSEEYLLSIVRDVGWTRRLERETLRVGERERLLLGKELHDGLAQHITGVAFMAKTLARKLVGKGGDDAKDAEEIGRLLRDAVGQIRVLAKGLELSEYEGRDLPKALEEMSGVVSRLMGATLEIDLVEGLRTGELELDRTQATQLYRICHDVVSDAVRNRMAQTIQVRLREQDGTMHLSIVQDGPHGFTGDTKVSEPSYRLRYRARLMDATLDVQELPRGGSRTTCTFSLRKEQDETG